MNSPPFAIAYGIWVRNQTGFLLCAAGLAAMALVYPMLFAYSLASATLIASTIPLIAIFTYVLNATIFAQEPGNLTSSYPRHMLVLPVQSRSLVFWPMFFGSMIAVCLLIVTVKIVYRSSGLAIPLGLPALALVVIVSWFQAIAWLPLKVRWVRALISFFAALALGSLPLWIIIRADPKAHLLVAGVLLAYLLAAYALAFTAVRADRRGDSWQIWFSKGTARRSVSQPERMRSVRPFRSTATAQYWYEWRCHGLVILIFLGSEMLAVWGVVLSGRRPIHAPLLPLIVGLLLFTPVLVVGAAGPMIGRFRPFWVDQRRFNTFMTVRPITSGGLVAAKLSMALVVVLSSWIYILIGTSACVVFSHSLTGAITVWNRFASQYPGGRAAAICMLTCLLTPALMWRMLTDGIPLALTGRKWTVDGAVCCYAVALVSLASGGAWLADHPEHLRRVSAIAPWLVLVGAIVKTGTAATAFHLAIRRKLISWAAFWWILAIWSALTAAAITLVLLLQPPANLVSMPSLVLGAATAVPLVRFPLASIALDWNRHR
jgi:hypothetical protein